MADLARVDPTNCLWTNRERNRERDRVDSNACSRVHARMRRGTIRSALHGVALTTISAVLASACGRSTDDRSSPSSAGASETIAGTSTVGGSPALGGGSNGESGTGDQSSSAGSDVTDAGAAGTPVKAECTSNQECGAEFCRFLEQRCVSCLVHSNCADDEAYIDGSCEKTRTCDTDTDCSSGKKCDPTWRRCLECTADADCGATATCDSGTCKPVSPCKNSVDCAQGVCDGHLGRCVECATSVDCKDGQRCANSACVAAPSCTSIATASQRSCCATRGRGNACNASTPGTAQRSTYAARVAARPLFAKRVKRFVLLK